jgi:hypothetical protein
MRSFALAWIFCCLSSIAAAELVRGKRYDFYQANGQNLLGAELLEESENSYLVKLSYLPKPLSIAKQNLLRPPQISQGQAGETGAFRGGRELRLNAQLGYTAITGGALHDVLPAGYHGAMGADWHLFAPPRFGIRALSVLGAFSYYETSPRSLRQFSFMAGPQFLLFEWQQPQIIFTGSALAGTAFVTLKGYTFSSEYTVFAAMGMVRAEKSFGPVVVGLQLVLNYLFDQSLNFTTSGLGLSVQYALNFR